jgi:hypothetical protein
VRWEKLGRVYVARGEQPWAQSRAFLPTTLVLGDRIRAFVAFLDEDLVGRVGWVDMDASDPTRVLGVSERPVLDAGPPGAFDEHGVNPICLLRRNGALWLYYLGWQRGTDVPYRMLTGLAVSDDDGATFRRHSPEPVLGRTDAEQDLRTGLFVLPAPDGGFRGWYSAGASWLESEGRVRPTYGLRYIESPDGIAWPDAGTPCMEPAAPDEYALSRPFVAEAGGRLRMWYSIRSHSRGYRMGYAESADGVSWARRDEEMGIDVSGQGWDSEMIHSGYVQETASGTYLFYNGNGYGETGFGVAVLADGG